MRLLIEIPEETVNEIKDNAMFAGSISSDIRWDVTSAIVNGTPQETVTEFADRCRECGGRYGKTLKRYIEKDIEMLNEIIESGWLISDLEKCPAIDACEDAIKALKQYGALQEIRQEITEIPMTIQKTRCFNEREISDYRSDVLEVIDKHIKEIEG